MPRPYRPSNGTEGSGFIDSWCGRCERDRHQDCPVVAASFQHAVDSPDYPKEWIYDDGGSPLCTAFVPQGEKVPPPRCDRTLDLFGEDPK